MKGAKLHIYGVTGYITADNNVKPLMYNTQHLEKKSEQKPINIEPVQTNENCMDLPKLMPTSTL